MTAPGPGVQSRANWTPYLGVSISADLRDSHEVVPRYRIIAPDGKHTMMEQVMHGRVIDAIAPTGLSTNRQRSILDAVAAVPFPFSSWYHARQ